MVTSLEMFIEWFQEFYKYEFLNLSTEFKNDWIEKILTNNVDYITKEEVMEFDACRRCGRCCIAQRCPHIDLETNLCERHDDPISDFCKEYPWGGDYGISPLTLNCPYQVAFFVNFFDNFFEKKTRRG